MKISYFNYHYDIEGKAIGAATQVRALVAALVRLGHQVDLQFRAARRPGAEPGDLGLKRLGLLRRYGHVPRLIWRNFAFLRHELRLLRAFRPDVVLAVSSYCNFSALLAARRLGLPLVLFAEAPLEYEYGLFFPQYHRYPLLGRGLEGLNVRGAAQVICISEILKGYLMRYGVPARSCTSSPTAWTTWPLHPAPRSPNPGAVWPEGPAGDRLYRLLRVFGDIPRLPRSGPNRRRRAPTGGLFPGGPGSLGGGAAAPAAAGGLAERFIFPGGVSHDRVPPSSASWTWSSAPIGMITCFTAPP